MGTDKLDTYLNQLQESGEYRGTSKTEQIETKSVSLSMIFIHGWAVTNINSKINKMQMQMQIYYLR